ncbi:uncharacterized protein LOC116866372 [Lontra canadensis]|uniref:uncharacterized protein LOC116866372 n=1 Tax=Lontra canadensis TaxID=76717 RepID=UPI0013F32A5B|nr:uncharacterized protein LOC116866372 [Lontra canadensis]
MPLLRSRRHLPPVSLVCFERGGLPAPPPTKFTRMLSGSRHRGSRTASRVQQERRHEVLPGTTQQEGRPRRAQALRRPSRRGARGRCAKRGRTGECPSVRAGRGDTAAEREPGFSGTWAWEHRPQEIKPVLTDRTDRRAPKQNQQDICIAEDLRTHSSEITQKTLKALDQTADSELFLVARNKSSLLPYCKKCGFHSNPLCAFQDCWDGSISSVLIWGP